MSVLTSRTVRIGKYLLLCLNSETVSVNVNDIYHGSALGGSLAAVATVATASLAMIFDQSNLKPRDLSAVAVSQFGDACMHSNCYHGVRTWLLLSFLLSDPGHASLTHAAAVWHTICVR